MVSGWVVSDLEEHSHFNFSLICPLVVNITLMVFKPWPLAGAILPEKLRLKMIPVYLG